MKASELIEKRSPQWQRLEKQCEDIKKRKNRLNVSFINEFASLYRDACADLSLATANQLPATTIEYLHALVAKAHNQLYRSRKFKFSTLFDVAFIDTPQRIFGEPCVHVATFLFWGLFAISGYLAYEGTLWPNFPEQVVGQESLIQVEQMYSEFGHRSFGQNSMMAGFYISHNAGIGLQCFASMIAIIPGILTLCFNAMQLGTIFGYMFRPEMGEAGVNFKTFVTAHGPFELTAIVLSAAAGLRIGLGWIQTNGLRRMDSILLNARQSLPIAMCAVVLFIFAAFIEGFISPATDDVFSWPIKGLVAVCSSALLMFYFIVLGYPRARA
ncbi:MAG: stage II sporulation protein M [Pirellulaceae bacterium]